MRLLERKVQHQADLITMENNANSTPEFASPHGGLSFKSSYTGRSPIAKQGATKAIKKAPLVKPEKLDKSSGPKSGDFDYMGDVKPSDIGLKNSPTNKK